LPFGRTVNFTVPATRAALRCPLIALPASESGPRPGTLTASDAVPLRLFSLTLPNLKAFEGFEGVAGFEGVDGVGRVEETGVETATAQVEKWPTTPLKRTIESSLVTATQPSAVGAAPPAHSGKAR
jgi:hypothetical protein